MKRVLFALLAAVAFVPASSTVDAQPTGAPPAFALGKPLPDGSMAAGSVSVRVVAGSPASPVPGTEVTVIVGNQPHVARTDASGRAVISNLPAGSTAKARILDAEGKEQFSDPFPIPSSGGVRVMLSTKPFTGMGGGGGGPMQGGQGGQGMPEPRKMSGQPRQDRETPAQTYVARLTYNDLASSTPPVDVPVVLVGYAADNSVIVSRGKSDKAGRATFPDLDPSGSVAYFALANLPRGTGVDRLHSLPVQMDGKVGFRTILSGEKLDSGAQNIDQYVQQQSIKTEPGKVRVTLEGMPAPGSTIQLFDAETHQVVAQVPASQMEGDPTTVQGGSKFEAKTDVPAGTVDVYVHGGVAADAALGDIELRVIAADAQSLEGADAVKTDATGKARVTANPKLLESGKQQRLVFKVLGREFVSDPFDISKGGGSADITAKWAPGGRLQAMFDVPYKAGQVLYAETTQEGKLAGLYRSLPFLLTEQSGIHVAIIVYPRLMMKFKMSALIEDQLFAVQGRFDIQNHSWIPYRAGPDGMIVPAPKGFKGGVVAEMNQNDVAIVPGEGFRIMKPLPPGSGLSFVGGFSLATTGGHVEWALDLPLGTVNSEMHIRETEGMRVELPQGVNGRTGVGRDGNNYFNVENITIGRGKSMVLAVHGLPQPAAWKIWMPRIVGGAVILIILGGLAFALFLRGGSKVPSSVNASKKAALLDELVELERTGGADSRRKEQLIAELEKLW
jgi:hypothetical protein